MNLLLINHYAGSDHYGMEYRPYYLGREWVRGGHDVTVVAASVSHVRREQPIVSGSVTEENIAGIRYLWLKTPGYHGNGVRRALNMLAFVGQLFRQQGRVAAGRRFDVVIASSTYPLDVYPAHHIARRHGAKLIYEVHDLWPLTPIEIGGLSKRHPFIWLLQRAEDYAYRHADHVVSLLPKADAYMMGRGMPPGKFNYLPNGIDAEEWQAQAEPLPGRHREVLDSLKQQGRFIIGYAGAFGAANALETCIDAAKALRNEPVAFVLVGSGPEKEMLERRIRDQQLANVILLPPISKACVPSFLREIDAAYIGLRNEALFRFGISPNKLMDYMMAERPVIQSIKAGNDIVRDVGCGFSIPPENSEEAAQAVRRLMNMSARERAGMGRKARLYVESQHDYRTLARRFLELVEYPPSRAA